MTQTDSDGGRAEIEVGQRVVVTGLPGSGKSTFSKALSAKAGLPVIHLDLHFWRPGWVAPSPEEWRKQQLDLLSADSWIADGNYHETLDLRLARADTVIVLDTPWLVCASRAVLRSLKSTDAQMPEGCPDSAWRRLKGELPVAGRVWQKRNWEPELERQIIELHGRHTTLHVLRSKAEAGAFLTQVQR